MNLFAAFANVNMCVEDESPIFNTSQKHLLIYRPWSVRQWRNLNFSVQFLSLCSDTVWDQRPEFSHAPALFFYKIACLSPPTRLWSSVSKFENATNRFLSLDLLPLLVAISKNEKGINDDRRSLLTPSLSNTTLICLCKHRYNERPHVMNVSRRMELKINCSKIVDVNK